MTLRPSPKRAGIAVVAALVVGAAATTGFAVLGRDADTSDLVWADEFDGARYAPPNPRIWTAAIGGDGWGNQELECYTDSRYNSALDGGGNLVITARHAPGHRCSGGITNDYTSARLRTEGQRTFRYGKVRVRAKLPTASGAWPAIWALGDNHDTAGWPRSGEIDVVEVVGSQPTTAHQTVHFPDAAGRPTSITATHRVADLPTYAWHTYGIDRTPTTISFSIDGRVTSRLTREQVSAKGQWVFSRPFYLLLNLAVGGTFPGPPASAAPFPQRMLVDYVRVYR